MIEFLKSLRGTKYWYLGFAAAAIAALAWFLTSCSVQAHTSYSITSSSKYDTVTGNIITSIVEKEYYGKGKKN